MRLKILKSKDLEELSDSMYENLSKVFVFLSSLLASIVVGWLAFFITVQVLDLLRYPTTSCGGFISWGSSSFSYLLFKL